MKEKEVKKVLQRWKPFFSYGVVLNFVKNRCETNRFAIVIWWKSVKTNVERNFFRRRFYDIMADYINKWETKYDFVFVVKKQTKLLKNDLKAVNTYYKDINFLLKKIYK